MHSAAKICIVVGACAISWAGIVAITDDPEPEIVQSPLVVPDADCPYLPAEFRANRKYDQHFRKAAAKHWPAPIERNWCWLKAQCAAESNLDETAESYAGAKGMCQFLDSTLDEVSGKIGRKLDPWDARDSIEAAAVYVIHLREKWTSPRPEHEAWRLAWASYNAGFSNILAAQRRAGGALYWREIERELPGVTGAHAGQTQRYVSLVSRYSGFP